MVDNDTVQILIQGGAVGLALAALALLGYAFRIISNHLVHVAEVLGRMGEQLDRLVDWLERHSQ